ncbi:MAG: coproporphyrinogen III oxidase [Symploca sp. SIO1C4]|uniref:Heme chaperone HemW n=1 Tax=Symploca sp. SIO1C4 TaxID=2607765 RepID=A0A6B3N8N5_9CYAN|nr:coproporphyrinogen III oxidase [Symploca sp. SIO1C4]NET07994.1 coproporphyrinogen III oxidase [Symploca sp. SIO2B6]
MTSVQSKPIINHFAPTSAYIHIPFCRRRCYYCDFPVSVIGDHLTGNTSGSIKEYVEVLCSEIETTPALGNSLKTVFFGGGTPSLLAVEQLSNILKKLKERFGIAAGAEISLEIDPGTFNLEQLQGYQDAGVNRVSLGVQAFQDQLLRASGRSHNSNEIFTAVETIRQVAIPEFSLDLISGLPHQTLGMWQASLEAAIKLVPTHISCYDLIVEPVTAFGRYYTPGAKPLPTDETTAQMYRLAQQILTSAGYEHYEISNYALPGHQCHHNRVYWENLPYYGFGMGAASYLQGTRFTRPRTRREYYYWVQQLIKADGILDSTQASETDVLLETLMLGLRLASGLSLSSLVKQFGNVTIEKIWAILQLHYHQGLVEVVGATGEAIDLPDIEKLPLKGRLRLSDPEGFLFSNTILADLFSQLA